MRQQYLRIKERYPDAILLFRLGDFYEAFDEDASLVAQELEITLTSRIMAKGYRIPMAGIPHHALEHYLGRLVGRGHKVAICEQLTPPGKGLVERDVVRVVTPGTLVEPGLLQERRSNYLLSVATFGEEAGIAYADITTGEFAATQLPVSEIAAELERLAPAEIVAPPECPFPLPPVPTTHPENRWLDPEEGASAVLEHFGATTLEPFGLAGLPLATTAVGIVLRYLGETQKAALACLTRLSTYSTAGFMALDPAVLRHLEVLQGLRPGAPSLLSVMDLTRTAMGGRLLRGWLGQPLLDLEALRRRQEAVAWLHNHGRERALAISLLSGMPDLERLTGRARVGTIMPRELVALKEGLEAVPRMGEIAGEPVEAVAGKLDPCLEVSALINEAISQTVRRTPDSFGEGETIRTGFSPELDEIRKGSRNAREYLASLEGRERERTGIKSLKVGYNQVFGYYIEVTRAHLERIPDDYQRRQTLVGAERFITPELKEYESLILNARERAEQLEDMLYRGVCQQVAAYGERLLGTARALAHMDAVSSLAEAAVRHGYTRPTLSEGETISIKGGRHPVVERSLVPGGGGFVPNDTLLSAGESQLIILTGPNMSGKSTFIRQVALIVLMAQVGSFVPAEEAHIGLVDRLFTRVGLRDEISAGQSTFMVEMTETARILHQATPRSLIILDEIGRGTSTYDGISIARAVAEYIHNHPRLGARTLFATHYHELVGLASYLPRVRNYNVAVMEEGGEVVFLHQILPGGSDRSYGIHVAQIAGMPRGVVQRAGEVLRELEGDRRGTALAEGLSALRSEGLRTPSESPILRSDRTPPESLPKGHRKAKPPLALRQAQGGTQIPLMPARSAAEEELAALDIDSLTPLEAITKLYQLRKKMEEG
ncbi:MAG: DNA mismatch repair protein MutS [Dehalococcoidia bacterium]|nr:DNA mismatch repair protein MutS [Dehalococcoidia bacterium]